jgi:hypothetical protein
VEYIYSQYKGNHETPHFFLACGPMISQPCCSYVKNVVDKYAHAPHTHTNRTRTCASHVIKHALMRMIAATRHREKAKGVNITYIDMQHILNPEDHGCAGHPSVPLAQRSPPTAAHR